MRPQSKVRRHRSTRHTSLPRNIAPDSAKVTTHLLVDWRRPHWAAACRNKTRIMYSERTALRFLDLLRERGPLLWWRISMRDAVVSPWRTWKEGEK